MRITDTTVKNKQRKCTSQKQREHASLTQQSKTKRARMSDVAFKNKGARISNTTVKNNQSAYLT